VLEYCIYSSVVTNTFVQFSYFYPLDILNTAHAFEYQAHYFLSLIRKYEMKPLYDPTIDY